MILKPPFIITSRLMAGLKIGTGTISIGYLEYNHEGRMTYDVWIDLESREFHVTDLRSGVGGGNLQKGMSSLLSFLGAAAESYRSTMRGKESENSDLFDPLVNEWAYQHEDEISSLQYEIEESTEPLIEED